MSKRKSVLTSVSFDLFLLLVLLFMFLTLSFYRSVVALSTAATNKQMSPPPISVNGLLDSKGQAKNFHDLNVEERISLINFCMKARSFTMKMEKQVRKEHYAEKESCLAEKRAHALKVAAKRFAEAQA